MAAGRGRVHNGTRPPHPGPRCTMTLPSKPSFVLIAVALIALAAPLLSSCASVSPEQASENSVTRHEQRDEGVADPMKER